MNRTKELDNFRVNSSDKLSWRITEEEASDTEASEARAQQDFL